MNETTLTPEQVWEKLANLEEKRFHAQNKEDDLKLRVGSLYKAIEKEQFALLKSIALEPNAEDIYVFCIEKDKSLGGRIFANDELFQTIEEKVADKPYAEKVFSAIMNHPEFDDGCILPDQAQIALLKMPALLEAYWRKGNDFYDDEELAMFNLPNKVQLLKLYFSCGHGLCPDAQKKLLQLPEEQLKPLLEEYINTINKKNYWQRALCQPGMFLLLRNKPLFELYTEKMAPYYPSKPQIFPKMIAFVAQKKGWL